MEVSKKQYYSIDIVKIIMAIIVVSIHIPPFREGTFIYYLRGTTIGGLAVPFFFVVSAYLLFSKIKNNPQNSGEIVKKYLLRIFKLYLLWSIIYLPCFFVRSYTGHYDTVTLKALMGEALFYIKSFFLDTSFMHLWYLNSLIFTVLILYFMSKKLSDKTILAIGILLFTVYQAGELLPEKIPHINLAIEHFPEIISNFIKTSFICTALGALAANSKTLNRKTSVILFSAFFAVYIGFTAYNYYILKNDSLISLFTSVFRLIIPYFILQICLNINLSYKPIYPYLRKISILIYFTHFLLIKEAFAFIGEITGIEIFVTCNWFRFLFDLIFAFAVSNLILFLQNKKGFRWMRHLY